MIINADNPEQKDIVKATTVYTEDGIKLGRCTWVDTDRMVAGVIPNGEDFDQAMSEGKSIKETIFEMPVGKIVSPVGTWEK